MILDTVHFSPEVGEIFQGTMWTLSSGVGDCDDHARVVYALLVAGGVPARLSFLSKNGAPSHVWAEAFLGSRWVPLETTLDAAFGEDPVAAAVRLGVIRADIGRGAKKIVTMGGVMVSETVRALQSDLLQLGYYGGAVDGIRGPRTILAVRNFQREHPNAGPVDGIAGPMTFAAVALALTHIASMGDMGAVPVRKTGSWTDNDLRNLNAMGKELRFDPVHLMTVMFKESGLEPGAINSIGCAGLIQFCPQKGVFGLGLPQSSKEIAAMSVAEQLPFVRRFYLPRAKEGLSSPGRMHLAAFLPALLSLPESNDDDFITTRADGQGPLRRFGFSRAGDAGVYEANKGFDVPVNKVRKGFITVRDLDSSAEANRSAKFLELVARFRAVGGESPIPPAAAGIAGVGAVGVGVFLGLAATAVYYWKNMG